MSAQENKAIARAFCEETWGKGNLAAVDRFTSSDFKVDYPILPVPLDREGFKSWVADTHTGFPDLQFIITDAIAEDDKVVSRLHRIQLAWRLKPQLYNLAPACAG